MNSDVNPPGSSGSLVSPRCLSLLSPLSSLSVLQRFPEACFLGFLFEEQTHHEKRVKQRFQTLEKSNGPVFSLVIVEKSEMLSWSGSFNGRRLTVYRSDLAELRRLITC